ncbi:MAG: hypothetical protein OJF47_001731 [Nitrospira sp.]|nr:MAG: hypothetical protein OJF47_001731 [Nitrospira sp.]
MRFLPALATMGFGRLDVARALTTIEITSPREGQVMKMA